MASTPFKPPSPEDTAWATVVVSYAGKGKFGSEVEWHGSEKDAMASAEWALNDALDGAYQATVCVVEVKQQARVDAEGKLVR